MPITAPPNEHVVEVGDDVVRVGLLRVAGATACVTPDRPPMVNSTIRPMANSIAVVNQQLAAPHGERPVDDLHAGGDGDEHRGHREHGHADRAEAAGEHVVRPHTPAEEADGRAGEDDELVAEQRLAAEHRQHLGDDAEAGQDEDVHLGVTEDPEQVLPQQRIGTRADVEERGAEVALEA